MASATKQQMSVEEFERLYMGKRAELWRGEVREYMPAGATHGKIAAALTVRIGARLLNTREGELFAAETGFVVQTPRAKSVLAPDVAFIRRERLPEGEFPPGFCQIVPDLVVEVVSPSDPYAAVREKVEEWLAGGVQLVWVVDPERRVIEIWRPEGHVQTLGEQDVLTGEPVLPGFQVKLSELFE